MPNRCYYCASYFGWFTNKKYTCQECNKSICFEDGQYKDSKFICKAAHQIICQKNKSLL